MSRTLSALRAKAEKDPKHRFRALSRLLDRQMLRQAFGRLKRRAAPGIDGVSWAEYAEGLEERLEKEFSKRCKGRVLFRRYADDSVVCFEREMDARAYLRALPERLEKFGLQLAEEKSSLVKFNKWEPEQSGKFTFLGFDFYWARTLRNPKHVVVKRRTNMEKLRGSLRALKEWLRKARNWKLRGLLAVLRRKLQCYWNYYGVLGNSMMTGRYARAVFGLLYKWLNRRSQRRSVTWASYTRRWSYWRLPPPQIVETPPPRVLQRRGKPA